MRLPPKSQVTCLPLLIIIALTTLCAYGGQQRRDHTLPPAEDVIVVLEQLPNGESVGELAIIYPLAGTLFPPELVPPTFRWEDKTPGVDSWVIRIAFEDENEILTFRARQASWSPEPDAWENIKRRSRESSATFTVFGVGTSSNQVVHSKRRPHLQHLRGPGGSADLLSRGQPALRRGGQGSQQYSLAFSGRSARSSHLRSSLQNLPVCGTLPLFLRRRSNPRHGRGTTPTTRAPTPSPRSRRPPRSPRAT